MSIENLEHPIIGVTIGDPAGIGPEIVVRSLSELGADSIRPYLIIGDLAHLRAVSGQLSINLKFRDLGDTAAEGMPVYDLQNVDPDLAVGSDQEATGRAAAEYIEAAIDLWRKGLIHAVCTAPISKRAINMAGYDFPGHTEFLAERTSTRQFAMSFFADRLRVILLSTHHALREAIEMVRKDAIADLIKFTDRELRGLLGRDPSIAVAGLNPHASEGGKFGSEEMDEISPAIDSCRALGIDVSGPYSPDTIFLRGHNGEFDAVLALYHDQATIAVKSLSFGSAVNVTLGLPLVRTSVDHGTAYDIAGKDIADASSMKAAMVLAVELATARK